MWVTIKKGYSLYPQELRTCNGGIAINLDGIDTRGKDG
jgi:hypothetical protein